MMNATCNFNLELHPLMGILLAHMNIVSVQFHVAGIDTVCFDGAPSHVHHPLSVNMSGAHLRFLSRDLQEALYKFRLID